MIEQYPTITEIEKADWGQLEVWWRDLRNPSNHKERMLLYTIMTRSIQVKNQRKAAGKVA